jgi:formamidopyrimidine-DNA glycosylase
LICVHLGMSGQLWFCPAGTRPARPDHIHCEWRLPGGRLVFRDPRRFGGLWTYTSVEELTEQRWSRLGPDALTLDARTLRRRLGRTHRAIKGVLLDQSIVAGIGNIYADEILFAARLHPASRVPADRCRLLARSIRQVLSQAIAAGGSTIRDYMDGRGQPGSYVRQHKVYGRAGQPCRRCDTPLETRSLGQRTTVFCPGCQDLFLGR